MMLYDYIGSNSNVAHVAHFYHMIAIALSVNHIVLYVSIYAFLT